MDIRGHCWIFSLQFSYCSSRNVGKFTWLAMASKKRCTADRNLTCSDMMRHHYQAELTRTKTAQPELRKWEDWELASLHSVHRCNIHTAKSKRTKQSVPWAASTRTQNSHTYTLQSTKDNGNETSDFAGRKSQKTRKKKTTENQREKQQKISRNK